MGRTRTAPPPPDTARAHIEWPPRPRAAGSRSAQCGGGARVPGAPRAAPQAAGAGRRGQSGTVSPPPARVAVIAGGRAALSPGAASSRAAARPKGAGLGAGRTRGAARGSGLCGRRRRTGPHIPGHGSRDLDSPSEVYRSLYPLLCTPSPPEVSAPRPRPRCALHARSRPDVSARRWVPSLRGFVCGPSGRAPGFSASQGRPLSLHGATPWSSLPACLPIPDPLAGHLRLSRFSVCVSVTLAASVFPGCLSLLGVSDSVSPWFSRWACHS